MDKLELVPLLMNIYKGFVILPKPSQLPPRNKRKIQTKINKRRKIEERRVLHTGMKLRTIRNTFLVNYFMKTPFRKKQNKINRRRKNQTK